MILQVVFSMSSLLVLVSGMAGGDDVLIGGKYKSYRSVVLIDTGYGVSPKFCSGVIVSRRHVMTSGVCCPVKRVISGGPRISIYAGSLSSWSDEAVLHVATNESKIFRIGPRIHDNLRMCLISLNNPLILNNVTTPAVIPEQDEVHDGKYQLYGFGSAVRFVDRPHTRMRAMQMRYAHPGQCYQIYHKSGLQNDNMEMTHLMCMLGLIEVQLCVADTGGPMFGMHDGMLYGISFGHMELPISHDTGPTIISPIPPMKQEIQKLILLNS